jgi:hypothetical protein
VNLDETVGRDERDLIPVEPASCTLLTEDKPRYRSPSKWDLNLYESSVSADSAI